MTYEPTRAQEETQFAEWVRENYTPEEHAKYLELRQANPDRDRLALLEDARHSFYKLAGSGFGTGRFTEQDA